MGLYDQSFQDRRKVSLDKSILTLPGLGESFYFISKRVSKWTKLSMTHLCLRASDCCLTTAVISVLANQSTQDRLASFKILLNLWLQYKKDAMGFSQMLYSKHLLTNVKHLIRILALFCLLLNVFRRTKYGSLLTSHISGI